MIVGVPKEVKDHETRVGLVPSGVTALREAGHQVLVQSTAGAGSVLTDEAVSYTHLDVYKRQPPRWCPVRPFWQRRSPGWRAELEPAARTAIRYIYLRAELVGFFDASTGKVSIA